MKTHCATIGLILAALALDLLAPPGLAASVLYAAPVWLAARQYGNRGALWVVGACSLLLLVTSPWTQGFPQPIAVCNRALSLLVLWGTGYTISRYRRAAVAEASARGREPSREAANNAALETDGGAGAWRNGDPAMPQQELRPGILQTRQFLASYESERRRLARQLHDGIGQLLAVICMHLHMARELGGHQAQAAVDECLRVSEEAIAQVREVSRELCPSMLDELGLLAALQAYLDAQARQSGLAVNLVASSSLGQLPGELESACFRVAQAALANAIEHASAEHVQVELQRDAEAVYLTIRDDGVGFDPRLTPQSRAQFEELGLSAMRQRIELLGGSCDVDSGPGRGTVIRACLPLGGNFGDASQVGAAPPRGGRAPGPARAGAAAATLGRSGSEGYP